MKNFILCLIACCTFLLFGFESEAATYNFQLKYGEPTTSDTQGYVNIFTKNKETGSIGVQTWFWEIANAYGGSSWMEVNFTTDGKVQFNPITYYDDNNDSYGAFMLCAHFSNGVSQVRKTGLANVDTYTYTISSTSEVYAVVPRGNVRLRGEIPVVTDQFNVMYGDDTYFYEILSDILTVISQDSNLLNTYLPKLNKIEFGVTQMYSLLQEIVTTIGQDSVLLNTYLPKLNKIEFASVQMYQLLQDLNDKMDTLLESSTIEQEAMNDFRDESFDQSNMLNGLNGQTQLNKPDVEDMSSTVDDNLNVDIDSNYGVLLSTFTSNNRILTMLLIVASVSLVSYVLFGKR